ncbi:MAG: hypothetical protein R6X14_06945 [bacterium]
MRTELWYARSLREAAGDCAERLRLLEDYYRRSCLARDRRGAVESDAVSGDIGPELIRAGGRR